MTPSDKLSHAGLRSFEALIEKAPFGVYVIDSRFRLIFVSAGSQKVFAGVRPLIGRDFTEVLRIVWSEPFASEAIARFRHTLETGESYGVPNTTELRGDKDIIESYDWKIERIPLPDGSHGVVCYFFDNTLRNQHAETLARAASRDNFRIKLADTLRSLADPLQVQNDTSRLLGEYLGVTRVCYFEMDGADYVVERSYAVGVPPLNGRYAISAFSPNIAAAYQAGHTLVVPNVREYSVLTEAEKQSHLGVQIVAFIGVPLVKGGVLVGGLAIHHHEPRSWHPDDVALVEEVAARAWTATERARSDASIRESEERFRGTFENAAIGVAHIGFDGRWLRFNEKICAITGHARGELSQKRFVDITHPDDVELEWSLARRLLAGEFPNYSLEKRYIRPDGSVVWTNTTVSLQHDGAGNARHFIWFVEDITERRNAKEEAEAAGRAKDDFLAALSHELRTPLVPVLLTAGEMEADDRLDLETRNRAAMIHRNIELEARLIDDLLDLTKIKRGKFQLSQTVLNLHDLIQQTRDIVESDYREKNVTLLLELAAAHSYVRADSARLQQVFWNLLKNAVKFSAEGQSVKIATSNPGSRRIQVSIGDAGIGMSAQAIDRVFQAFDQGDLQGRHRFGGLGLGLAISKAITDLHGGTITAESPGLGLGSTFRVELDVCEAPIIPSSPPPLFSQATSPLRLLVVEDHEPSLRSIARLLERDGHTVHTASSIHAALLEAQSHVLDAIISDLGLPDGSGNELMREIALKYRLPGIALSGFGMEDDVQRSIEAGFSAHIVKPVTLQKLRGEIQKLAQQKAALDR